MTREVFDWAESPGSSFEEAPKVKATAFGDGYSQRMPDGINPSAQVWKLRFRQVSHSAGGEIIAFFRRHGAWKAFEWTPVWATQPILVVCTTWSRSLPDEVGVSDITATFQQVFEP